jgi:hypothetical protein
MHARIAVSATILALAMPVSLAQAQTMQLTPAIALTTLDQPAVDPAFEAKTLADLSGVARTPQAAGAVAFLLRKDRGPHVGRYAVFVTMPGGRAPAMAYTKLFPKLSVFQLVAADGVGPLPSVDVLGVHYIKVRPDRVAGFENFVADKLNPAVANLRPDLRFLHYKESGGPNYLTIIAITRASRDKYWPKGADSDELRAAFTPAVRALAEELKPFLVDGSWGVNMVAQVYEAKEWADWFAVGPTAR